MTALAKHGIVLRHETLGTHRVPCPQCPPKKGDTALAVTLNRDGSTVWYCFRCSWKGALRPPREPHRPARRHLSLTPRPEPEPTPAGLSCAARSLWATCRAITAGSPASVYLRGRGCALPENDVRWHPALPHPCGHVGPALVARVTDVLTGEPINLHKTWLTPDGSGKAQLDKPRLLAKGHRKKGGIIRLWPDEALTYGLLVAEGLETGLTAALGFAPAWATIDAGNLAAFPVLDGIESLTVAVDHDRAGLDAFNALAARWLAAGREVRQWLPPQHGADINDWAGAAA